MLVGPVSQSLARAPGWRLAPGTAALYSRASLN